MQTDRWHCTVHAPAGPLGITLETHDGGHGCILVRVKDASPIAGLVRPGLFLTKIDNEDVTALPASEAWVASADAGGGGPASESRGDERSESQLASRCAQAGGVDATEGACDSRESRPVRTARPPSVGGRLR